MSSLSGSMRLGRARKVMYWVFLHITGHTGELGSRGSCRTPTAASFPRRDLRGPPSPCGAVEGLQELLKVISLGSGCFGPQPRRPAPPPRPTGPRVAHGSRHQGPLTCDLSLCERPLFMHQGTGESGRVGELGRVGVLGYWGEWESWGTEESGSTELLGRAGESGRCEPDPEHECFRRSVVAQ